MNWNEKLVKLLVIDSSGIHHLARPLKIPLIVMLTSSDIFSYLGKKKKKSFLGIQCPLLKQCKAELWDAITNLFL